MDETPNTLQLPEMEPEKSRGDRERADILEWIKNVSEIRSELGGFSICPFSKKANYEILKIVCNRLIVPTDTIVSGGANGADTLAKRYAIEHSLNYKEYLPDWKTYGKRAGFIRNQDIIDNSDFVFAFWDGASAGTKNSIDLAKLNKTPTLIIYF